MERFKQNRLPINSLRETVEKPIQLGLERLGFVRVEDEQTSVELRLAAMQSLWALQGLDFLLDLPSKPIEQELQEPSSRLIKFKKLIDDNSWKESEDYRTRGVINRLMAIRSRKKLLMDTIEEAFSLNAPIQQVLTARSRLEQMFDVIEDKLEKPKGTKRAIILTQTSFLFGSKKDKFPHGFDSWFDFAVKLGGGAMPYLGAAVVYSELMNTGEFSHIEIADFHDQEIIQKIIDHKDDYDLVLISGATTSDLPLIDCLNKRLSQEGLPIINGGVAATISDNPQRYLENGSSVFIGEFEGAAPAILNYLDKNKSPTIFVRGRENSWDKKDRIAKAIIQFKQRGYNITFLDQLSPKVSMEEAYSVEKERQGYLAKRLEALEKMRPIVSFGGINYELPSSFKPHEINISFGCPNTCVFCATAKHQGTEMRIRSLDSIRQELQAVETKYIAAVDQNLTANGRRFFQSLLLIADSLKKKIAFQGELLFFKPGGNQDDDGTYFDGTKDDEERKGLLKRTVLAIEVGLEHPISIKGVKKGRKDPSGPDFIEALKLLNDLGVIAFATAMIGVPKMFLPGISDKEAALIIPSTDLSENQWQQMVTHWLRWLDTIPCPGTILFPFTIIPGTSAHHTLQKLGLLKNPSNTERGTLIPHMKEVTVAGIDAEKALIDIGSQFYKRFPIIKRLFKTRLSFKHGLYMFLFNLMAAKAIRDRME